MYTSHHHTAIGAVVIGWLALLSSAQNYAETTDSRCDCYMAKSTEDEIPFYYTSHEYWDFTGESQYASSVPGLIENAEETEHAEVTSDYFASSQFQDRWTVSGWNNSQVMDENESNWLKVMSRNNVYLEQDESGDREDTYLVLRTVKQEAIDDDGEPFYFQSSAEIATNVYSFQYLSTRMEARTIGQDGACTAMFTYGYDGSQESDIEFITRNSTSMIHFTNQPGDHAEMTISGLDFQEWHQYRMDWTDGQVSWYIDDEFIYSSQTEVPTGGLDLFFNSWGDGSSWTGPMKVGDEAFLHIRRIEYITNTTDTNTGTGTSPVPRQTGAGGCHNVCSIDLTATPGTPVLLNEGNQASNGGEVVQDGGCVAQQYDQCGGNDHQGCTQCGDGLTCTMKDQWYSQCL